MFFCCAPAYTCSFRVTSIYSTSFWKWRPPEIRSLVHAVRRAHAVLGGPGASHVSGPHSTYIFISKIKDIGFTDWRWVRVCGFYVSRNLYGHDDRHHQSGRYEPLTTTHHDCTAQHSTATIGLSKSYLPRASLSFASWMKSRTFRRLPTNVRVENALF